MGKVVESYFQGRSLVLKEKSVPWKLSSGKCYLGTNRKFSGYIKYSISLLKMCLEAGFSNADLCKARESP